MATEVSGGGGGGSIEVSPWLKSMAVAPEYHPTLAEFRDPIAYIFKIEKEASEYGICKIVPPVPPGSKKTIVANFNKSLLARSTDPESGPTFTTRQQQIGFCPRKHRPVQKPVWQSGERYTLSEFETKAKNFEKNYLRKYAKKGLSALEVETLYWNAIVDKPFTVEYANDMPGSAFVALKNGGGKRVESTSTVGETEWNMRRVSRENLSLLRFMKEEIPGVTSPMVYVAMMFSWFAWHVEDHDLHSLNYLHMGAGKTWYGVPRGAAVAFEEVVRENGYGGEINPLVTFATLGEKTTVMSPEVLLSAGVPCCRLVQNAGEFVVTFPRAYHSGFSHGFNCGEAANIATPEWLRFAREAAIRRAATNCSPMVSHFQLLYDLALSLCSRTQKSITAEPRSSRLKDRKKGEGETLVKEFFFQDMMQNNDMLHILGKGSSVVLLPQNSLSRNTLDEFLSVSKSRLFPSLFIPDLELNTSCDNANNELMLDRKQGIKQARRHPGNRTASSLFGISNEVSCLVSQAEPEESETNKASQCEQGLFSCVACGILCFSCVALVQPTEVSSRYLMSADCSTFNSLAAEDIDYNHAIDAKSPNLELCSALVQSQDQFCEGLDTISHLKPQKEPSSLGLLALAYGNTDSDDDNNNDMIETDMLPKTCENSDNGHLENGDSCHNINSKINCRKEDFSHRSDSNMEKFNLTISTSTSRNLESNGPPTNNCTTMIESDSSTPKAEVATTVQLADPIRPFSKRSDEDSSRVHVFCLQHALQVEKQLSHIGGAHVFLVCHPDYPKLESEAKKVAEELGNSYLWNEFSFREANEEDEEMIRLALKSENAIHGNRDWAVKMGINLFYSANLSRNPLYSKQMHYNSVIYGAFGRSSPVDSLIETDDMEIRDTGRQKKIIVAGKWCGKVWMSNQAHPLLVNKDLQEKERDRPSEGSRAARLASVFCRTARKIKNSVKRGSNAKRKSRGAVKTTESIALFPVNDRCKRTKRKRRTQVLQEETPQTENIDDSCDELQSGNANKQIKKHFTTKRLKKVVSEIENLDESSDSDEFPLSNAWNHIKNKRSRAQEMKNEMPENLQSQQRSKKRINEPTEDDEAKGGPSTRLRKRRAKPGKDSVSKSAKPKPVHKKPQKDATTKKGSVAKVAPANNKSKVRVEEGEYECDMEGCAMSFRSKQELALHKRNICPVKDCGKKFFSHKYLVQHRRVHMDDRPLKCPWKGCKMTFKWAWARTEHIRVHTGARPYVCTESGCGQTFRFVSDFSRHKRKTGHSPKKMKG